MITASSRSPAPGARPAPAARWRRNRSPAARPSPNGVGTEKRNGTSTRVPAIGASHISMSRCAIEILDRGPLGPMAGDRRVEHGADHDRALIALVGLHLIHALEHEVDVDALAAVEDRDPALAGVRREHLALAGDRDDGRAHRIDHALAVRFGDRHAVGRRLERRLGHDVLHGAGAQASCALRRRACRRSCSTHSWTAACWRPAIVPREPPEPEPSEISLTSPVVRPLATAVYWSGAMSMTQVPLPSGMPASEAV